MRVSARAAILLGITAPFPALAGDKPLYQPAPAWILPAPPVDPAKPGGGEATPVVILDQQQRLEDGQVWSYVDSATRITTEQALAQAGTIKVQWEPEAGDLIVHRIAIVRGDQTIDLLSDPAPLTVLRREQGLEQLEINGVLTATMPVKGLQVGDVLRTSYSTTHADPVLKGAMQSQAILIGEPARADFARVRVLWKTGTPVKWQVLEKTEAPVIATKAGYSELVLKLPAPKQPELPGDAPRRYQPIPAIELSTFADWPAVSRVMAPLYGTQGTIAPGTPLAAEVARIRAASADPKVRAAMALRTVQSEVRYLFNGLDHGNYVPQTPEKTWSVRYGDCKAKTLLLLALLAELGVKAEPVLANLTLDDYVPKRLPSAAAFNHVLVHAMIDGADYWLDGTGAGTRLADIGDSPELKHVLPVRAEGAGLLTIVPHADARPRIEVADTVDQSAGIGIPAPFTIKMTFRGPLAEQIFAATAAVSAEKKREMLDSIVTKFYGAALIVDRDVSYDADSATAVVRSSGLVGGDWDRDDRRFEFTLDRMVNEQKFDGDRARPEWRDIPVATSGIQSGVFTRTIRLPDDGKGFELEGDQTLPPSLAGATVKRVVTQRDGVITFEDHADEIASEIAPGDVAAVREQLTRAKARLLKVKAPRDYPRRWLVVRAARAAGKFKPIEAAYAKAIADADSDKKPGFYRARAWFRSGIYDREGAIADLGLVISSRPDADAYLSRAGLYWQMGKNAEALADARAAYALDPGDLNSVIAVASYEHRAGQTDAAVKRLDERIADGGENKAALLDAKSDILMQAGRAEPALAAVDQAITAKPGAANLLNSRCWIKAALSIQLDTALKDCTKSIEQGYGPAQVLDSRALAYFKLGRFDDALVDLNAALEILPELAASLYMRGIIEQQQGNAVAAAADLAAARHASPRIDELYALYGVKAGPAVR